MYGAWPMNAYALLKLQKNIAKEIGIKMGSMTTISCSAHIYKPNWKKATNIYNDYYKFKINLDPRGYFTISLDKNKISLRHFDNNGKLIKRFLGKNSDELIKIINKEKLTSELSHATYLGKELYKAEIALKYNKEYIQDKEIF